MSTSWTKEDRDALDAMFVRADAAGLWFYHGGMSGPLWFSPAELRREQAAGRFVWGAQNWVLRDPIGALRDIDARIDALKSERDALLKRMEAA